MKIGGHGEQPDVLQDLNQRYFAGGLPRYQVIVAPQLHHASGRLQRSRRIYLQPTFPDVMLQILLHEMAHASTNDHCAPLWRAEMQRLQALGALSRNQQATRSAYR